MKIVLATNNAHKLAEFRSCFAQKGIAAEIVSLAETGFSGEIVEDADSFEGNAYIKAKTICDFTGMTVIADDSGLAVDALGGAPGVFSARYAGDAATDTENTEKLLSELKKCPEKGRKAKFVCVICALRPDGEILYVRGECEGEITEKACGNGGFGYDPVFFCPVFGRTFAEITDEEKNSVSHRGMAVERLLEHKSFFEA